MTVEQELDNAYQRMRTTGWWQGEYLSERGQVCLLGSIIYGNVGNLDDLVDDEDDVLAEYPGAQDVLLRTVLDRYPEASCIATANDNFIENEDEALELLEKARARAAELGI